MVLDDLSTRHPLLFSIPTTAAEIALDAGDTHGAAIRAQRVLHMAPDYFPAQWIEARALLAQMPQRAYELLQPLTHTREEDPVVWQLYANAAQASGHILDGAFAMMTYRQLTGELSAAMRPIGCDGSTANTSTK